MILSMYCVFDKVLGVFGPIIECQNDKVLIRQTKEMMSLDFHNPKNDFIAHSQDLVMYKVGERNTETGDIVGCRQVQVFLVSDLKNEVEQELLAREERRNEKRES